MYPVRSGSVQSTRTSIFCLIFVSLLLAVALGCTSSRTQTAVENAKDPSPTSRSSGTTPDVVERHPGAELEAIYFDTDDARLRADARHVLAQHARAIVQNPEWGVITVEGHCDERGSNAYNHALGKRRAASVERFLVAEGVPKSRIETRTLGSAQPAVTGHGEQAWKMNRRSEFRRASLLSKRM